MINSLQELSRIRSRSDVAEKPANTMECTASDAGAGEHGHRQLGDHGQVDADPIALLHPELLQNVGEAADLAQQFPVGQAAIVIGVVALPEDRDLIAVAGLDVSIEAVAADVELAALEPADLRFAEVGIQDLLERSVPVQPFRLPAQNASGSVTDSAYSSR